MILLLTLFAPLTYVNVLDWIVRSYYHSSLVNEGNGLILVIQTFYPSSLSVLHTQRSLYDPLLLLLL